MRCELGTICSRLSSGKSLSAKFVHSQGKYPVYGGNGLRGYTDTYNFDGECAIIGRQGAFCGNVRYFKGAAYMTEHAVVLCADENNSTQYLAYLLSTMQLGRLSAQSAQPGLSVKTLSKQIIDVPSLETQSKVAAILCALDEKIELNNKINWNLERQAFALFDKLMVDSDNTEWQVSDIAYLNPKRPLSKNQVARCIDMSQLSTTGAFPSGWEMKSFTGGMRFTNGDTLLARITPCLENGKTAFIDFLDKDEVAFGSTEYIVLAPKEGIPAEFLYCLARYPAFVDYAEKNMNGSSGRQRVSAETIGQFALPEFSKSDLSVFGTNVTPMFRKMRCNYFENLRLAALRDVLLPKLMSGKIDVTDIQL